MGQVVNLFQLAQPGALEGLSVPFEQRGWDDEVRQPAVSIALVLMSTVSTLFVITSALRWMF